MLVTALEENTSGNRSPSARMGLLEVRPVNWFINVRFAIGQPALDTAIISTTDLEHTTENVATVSKKRTLCGCAHWSQAPPFGRDPRDPWSIKYPWHDI